MAAKRFYGVRLTQDNLGTLDALQALTDTANRSEALRTLLDAPVASLMLAISTSGIAANKKTAHLRQTGGAGLAAITEEATFDDKSILPQLR